LLLASEQEALKTLLAKLQAKPNEPAAAAAPPKKTHSIAHQLKVNDKLIGQHRNQLASCSALKKDLSDGTFQKYLDDATNSNPDLKLDQSLFDAALRMLEFNIENLNACNFLSATENEVNNLLLQAKTSHKGVLEEKQKLIKMIEAEPQVEEEDEFEFELDENDFGLEPESGSDTESEEDSN